MDTAQRPLTPQTSKLKAQSHWRRPRLCDRLADRCQGTPIPDAADQLTFDVSGTGSFEAVCNGDATSLESFKQPTMKLFNGQLVVIVRGSKQPGTLTLKVADAKRSITGTIDIPVD